MFKYVRSVCFITIFCSIFYTTSAEDIKQLIFRISADTSIQATRNFDWKCDSDPLDTKVGEKFEVKISNSYHIRFTKNLCDNAEYLKFTTNTNNELSISFTKPGSWKYTCVFYQVNKKPIICSTTVRVKKDVEPSGYLLANTYNISSSEGEYIYKYHAGDTVNFTCFRINGNSVYLSITSQGTWIIVLVFSLMTVLVLIAAGIWIAFRYKTRKRTRKNSPSIVYYQDSPRRLDSSVTNSPPIGPEDLNTVFGSLGDSLSENPNHSQKIAVQKLTYFNNHQINNNSSVQDNESNYAVVYKSQPNYATSENTLQKNKEDASGNKQNASYEDQNMIKLNRFDNLNIKDDDTKSKVSQNRKETQKNRPGCIKEHDVMYADLALATPNSRNFIPPKMSNYSEIRKIQANVKNDLEPAYCEIMPTKTKS